MESEAVLAGAVREPADARAALLAMLLRRMDGVLKLRDSKLLMFRAEQGNVDALRRLLPDADPLVQLPDDGNGALRLQTMCHGAVTWQRLEELNAQVRKA